MDGCEQPIDIGTIEHLAAMGAGALLLAIGLSRKGFGGTLARLGGAALLVRGATGYEPLYNALGIPFNKKPTGASHEAIRVESSIEVSRPAEDLYLLWRDFENLPAFMSNLHSVRRLDDVRSHWIAKGPAGTTVRWDAIVINDIPNELIAWETMEGSSIDHAGSVHFEPLENGETRVRVVLRYDPPAGKLGEALANLFQDDPQSQIDEDLLRFQKMIDGLGRAGTPKLL
jgi:uncharacterized membrane protein